MLKPACCALLLALSVAPALAAETAPAVAPPDVKPYDTQLLRLAEILGALSYLRGVCGSSDGDV